MIFRYRRLLAFSLFTILCVFLAQALPQAARLVFVFITLSLFALSLAVSFRISKLRFVAILLLCAALSFLSSYFKARPYEELAPYEGNNYNVAVRVEERTSATDAEICTAKGRLVSLEGKQTNIRVKLETYTKCAPGDILTGDAILSQKNISSYDAGQGLSVHLSFEDAEVTGTYKSASLLLYKLRTQIVTRIRSALPTQTGELFAALLLGVRDGLSEDFERDMTRIGTTHMLSLSGMHLVILSSALEFLLRRLRLGTRARSVLLGAFIIFFMALTGFSSTVMRASFMFLFSVFARFLRQEQDSFTSLFVAVAVIGLAEPYAVKDLSLWLSALATLGILLFFERKRKKESEKKRSFLWQIGELLFASFYMTAAAMIATLPLTVFAFGTFPLLSPIANLLLAPLVQVALYLSAAVALFGALPLLCTVSEGLGSLIFALSHTLSSVEDTVLSLENPIFLSLFLCFFGGMLVYFLFCPPKRFHLRVPLCFLLICAVVLGGTLSVRHLIRGNKLFLTAVSDTENQEDLLLLEKGRDTLMIATGGIQTQLLTKDRELDGFLLLTYSEHTVTELESFLGENMVHTLYLPKPKNGTAEEHVYQESCAVANEASVAVITYPWEEAFLFEGLSVSLLFREILPDGGTKSLAFELIYGEKRLVYFSGQGLSYMHKAVCSSADTLWLGCYGGGPTHRFVREEFFADADVICPHPRYFPFEEETGIVFKNETSLTLSP